MKRITRKKLELNKQTVRVLVRPIDSKELKQVVGGGSLINCQTRCNSTACSYVCGG